MILTFRVYHAPNETNYSQPGHHLDPRIIQEDRYLIADYPVIFEDTTSLPVFDANALGHPFNQFFRDLEPVKELKNYINNFDDRINNKTYGINIRRGMGLNYHPNSTILSPNTLFYQLFKDLMKADSEK
jgi:hypothetical protein